MVKLNFNINKLLIRSLLKVASWIIIIVYLIISFAFVTKKNQSIPCTSIEVRITDKTGNLFIVDDDVIQTIKNKNENLIGMPIAKMNKEKFERLLIQHPCIRKAEVYTTLNGVLKIDIEQREPIARIITQENNGMYIDSDGKLMPLSTNYTARVLVVNGAINNSLINEKSIDLTQNTSLLLHDIYVLSKYIYNDKFLKAAIEQIYVEPNYDFVLLTKVENHEIIFGSIDRMEEKFENLKLFYTRCINEVGWNVYKKINIKYKNQIIGIKNDIL